MDTSLSGYELSLLTAITIKASIVSHRLLKEMLKDLTVYTMTDSYTFLHFNALD
jgi:hypothetical protein